VGSGKYSIEYKPAKIGDQGKFGKYPKEDETGKDQRK
jgi:hypothetical protein